MSIDLTTLRVAIVHYWFLDPRGGEKVIEAFCELLPSADIFTHVLDRKLYPNLIANHKVTTSFIQRLPYARRATKYYLPLMPIALEQFDLSEYDLIISSESGPAKGVIVREDSVHFCYCHSPMRYIWNKYAEEVHGSPAMLSWPMRLSAHYLRLVDYASAARVDQFVANSWHQTLKNRILLENYYLPGDLETQIKAFVADYNHCRYRESIDNLTPADVYFGRGPIILAEREKIKRQTIADRRLQHQLHAA